MSDRPDSPKGLKALNPGPTDDSSKKTISAEARVRAIIMIAARVAHDKENASSYQEQHCKQDKR